MATLLYRLGRWAARRPATVITAWIALLALAATGYVLGSGALASTFTIPGTPTAQVTQRLEEQMPRAAGGTASIVFQTSDDTPLTEQQRQAISDRLTQAADLDGVETTIDPFTTQAQRTAEADELATGRTELDQGRQQIEQGLQGIQTQRTQAEAAGTLPDLEAELDAQQAELQQQLEELDTQEQQLDLGQSLMDMAAQIQTVSDDDTTAVASVVFTDPMLDVAEDTKQSVVDLFDEQPLDGIDTDYSSDLSAPLGGLIGTGEIIGLLVAATVLIIMLGTLAGAGLPLATALTGVGIGALGTLALSGAVEMVSVTPVLGIMLGLAVGIDYSLFIVHRHRRQLLRGTDVPTSIALANGTSGNAVVFAGTTVFIALLALNITGIPFLGLMGTVGALCIVIAVLVATTLTPALLGLLGTRILKRSERTRAQAATPDDHTAPTAPALSTPAALLRVLVAAAALIAVALPALDLRLGIPDGSSEEPGTSAYQAYTTVADKFGPGTNGPLLLVADLPPTQDDTELLQHQADIAEQIHALDDVVAIAPIGTSDDQALTAFQILPAEGPTSASTEQLVHHLRSMSPLDGGFDISVAGQASGKIDISDKLADALPAYLAVVIGLSLIIMVLVFRSVFVPLIATTGFILSFFAALGGVVAIYQWGWLSEVFGVHTPGPILNFLPTILVGVLFGLAMDYMLFIGSGMREAYAHGTPARAAVGQGLKAGRSVVTAAAIIMVSVFGGFIFSHTAMIRPIGFALAFGVLIDAFVVRMYLIPALMHLAGDQAWWLPRWLDRLLPDVDVEGASLHHQHPDQTTRDEDENDPVSVH
ncbi:MMPL family transporter [Nocardiopsis sp. CNT312]|uniref:MMPL family transporter n=1 Tax=Nocardiopsis sp. CNT312 TaxID=1137268 RepID=UPI0004904BF8|nr:MMPL family transporter [Nocardiopsis sp. CNT312]